MHQNLRLTLVQSNLHWENIDSNLAMFSQKIAGITTSTDLIVLPEMFSTGFSMHVGTLAEEMDKSRAIEWMKRTAAEKECVVTGSLMIKEAQPRGKAGTKYYNRLIWMEPDGHYMHYDKRHLFSLSNEEQVYTAGDSRIVTVWKGWKICPLVCYDLRFPVWSRNSADGYDLLLYVANWPERRIYAWKQLLVARAIENQCYVAGLNRVGNDGSDIYHSGDSMVADAVGNLLYHKKDEEDVATVELSYEALQKTREALPFLKDADMFALNPKGKIRAH